jgi:hypothetical protein
LFSRNACGRLGPPTCLLSDLLAQELNLLAHAKKFVVSALTTMAGAPPKRIQDLCEGLRFQYGMVDAVEQPNRARQKGSHEGR